MKDTPSNQSSQRKRLEILVCTAGPEPAKRLKAELVRIADFFEAHLTVLKVLPHGSPIPADELRKRGEEAVEIIVDVLERQGLEADPYLKFSDDTAKGIVETAREIQADLLIMGVGNKPSWLRKFIQGDVSERVIHGAPCPVITLPQTIERSPFDGKVKSKFKNCG